MKCEKCGELMVRLEDGTLDCGCNHEPETGYPGLDTEHEYWVNETAAGREPL